ncbi:dTDP-4-dehydrorhamnose 3,5-epimerase family protein [Nocardioides carbamazepini]|uniref:dTDP-4-dehydrorhamnose 3,5-epimerase family protein n=1 Tax=Nocardioides carbamazepini TaxID=2854259 RepID=UPI00214A4C1F|nr:dTDP-4-dehydrorhamnose 3,5-epimerase family protein [Nocardioides carbamazepini]
MSEETGLAGVRVVPLTAHADERGQFVEVFRDEWDTDLRPVQWNAVRSHAGVMRGVHVHVSHHDYLTVLAGTLVLGLHDLRPESPSAGLSSMLTIDAAAPVAVAIPPGVGHGFWFPEPSVHLYGVDRYWNVADELGCRYDEPALGLDWPVGADPLLSERDRVAPDYATMRAAYLTGSTR